MKEISSSRLVRMLNDGFEGRVVFSGDIKFIANGTPISESRGEFCLTNNSNGKSFLIEKKVDGVRAYYSNFEIRGGKSPKVDEEGGVAIPVDYIHPQEDHPGIWMMIRPEKITY